jgi:hypothetical protein
LAEWHLIWTVGLQVGEESKEDVNASKETYQTKNDTSNHTVDREEEIGETGEEKEGSYVGQCRYGLHSVMP